MAIVNGGDMNTSDTENWETTGWRGLCKRTLQMGNGECRVVR